MDTKRTRISYKKFIRSFGLFAFLFLWFFGYLLENFWFPKVIQDHQKIHEFILSSYPVFFWIFIGILISNTVEILSYIFIRNSFEVKTFARASANIDEAPIIQGTVYLRFLHDLNDAKIKISVQDEDQKSHTVIDKKITVTAGEEKGFVIFNMGRMRQTNPIKIVHSTWGENPAFNVFPNMPAFWNNKVYKVSIKINSCFIPQERFVYMFFGNHTDEGNIHVIEEVEDGSYKYHA